MFDQIKVMEKTERAACTGNCKKKADIAEYTLKQCHQNEMNALQKKSNMKYEEAKIGHDTHTSDLLKRYKNEQKAM